MNFGSVLQHLRDTSKHFGPAAALYDAEYRGVNHLVPVQVLRAMALEFDDLDSKHFDSHRFTGRFCSREDLFRALSDPEIASQLDAEFVHRARARGDECHGMFYGDRLVSFIWYSTRPTPCEDDLVVHVDPAWVYMYKAYTVNEFRGRRLNAIGVNMASHVFSRGGSSGLVCYVEANNYSSLRAQEHMGFHSFGAIYVARAFGRTLTWATPGCKPYGFYLEWTGDPQRALA
jgi:hypothetical protein